MGFAFLAWGAAHAAVGWTAYQGDLELGTPLAAATVVGPLLLGIFGTLPGIPALTAGSGEASRVHWTQIFGLLFAALVPLGALILMLATGLESTASFVVVAAATVSVIVLALGPHVAARRPGAGAHRAARPRPAGGDGRALERRGDARRPDGPRQLCEPRAASDARATTPTSWVGRHLLDVVAEEERDSAIAPVRTARRIRQRRHGRVRGRR